jgi:hypothetical protein
MGSCLALFALAIQFALSFGHLHLDDITAGPSRALSARQTSSATTTAPDPVKHNHSGRAHDTCAICALIHLAKALLPTQPPSLPQPLVSTRLELAAAVEFGLTPPDHASFAARAPPLA